MAKVELKTQIAALLNDPRPLDNPISEAFLLDRLRDSGDETENAAGELLAAIGELRADFRHTVADFRATVESATPTPVARSSVNAEVPDVFSTVRLQAAGPDHDHAVAKDGSALNDERFRFIAIQGSFNPGVFSPPWLESQALVDAAAVEQARVQFMDSRPRPICFTHRAVRSAP